LITNGLYSGNVQCHSTRRANVFAGERAAWLRIVACRTGEREEGHTA
jgi:hypothetical protein